MQWQLAPSAQSHIFIPFNSYDEWHTFEIPVPNPPAEGDFTIRIYQPVFYHPELAIEYKNTARQPRGADADLGIGFNPVPIDVIANGPGSDGRLLIDNVFARLLFTGVEPAKESSVTEVRNPKNTLIGKEVVTQYADVPEYRNRELIYPTAWRVIKADGTRELTRAWTRPGYDEDERLTDLLLNARVEASARPHEKITGTLDGNVLPIDYLRITYHRNKVYKINGFTWDVRKRSVQVELIEVLTDLPVRPDYLLTEEYLIITTEENTAIITEGRT